MESNHRAFYKNQSRFGTLEQNRVDKRKSAVLDQKKKREDSFFVRRNIREEPEPASTARKAVKTDTRREKLLKWKAEKEALLKEKQKRTKPPFRTGIAQYPSDPFKDVASLPKASTVKLSTLKKAASTARGEALKDRKNCKPTTAAASLAALSSSSKSCDFTGRVTRARAAATSSVASNTRSVPYPSVRVQTTKEPTRRLPARCAATSTTCFNVAPLSSNVEKSVPPPSFAPKNHKFKAPISLTLPTTPLALKRKNPNKKANVNVDWPTVPGVSKLPASPKIGKSPRRCTPGRRRPVTKTPKLGTPSKSIKKNPKRPKLPMAEKSPAPEAAVSKFPVMKGMELEKGVSQGPKTPTNHWNATNEDEKENVSSADLLEITANRASRMSIHESSPPVEVTPDKLATGMVPAQFSPYITAARGKERHSIRRRSTLVMPDTTPQPEEHGKAIQVDRFRSLLQNETSRLLSLCDTWDEISKSTPSTTQDVIFGAVGQARLLTKDKFQQFKRLVDNFESGATGEKITVDDLTGFWEMMQLTVSSIDGRFDHLKELQANNWVEKVPEIVVKKKLVPKVKPAPKVSCITSRLKAIVEAARKRKEVSKHGLSNKSNCKTFDGGFFKVESPKVLAPAPPKSPASNSVRCLGAPTTPGDLPRRSLLQHALNNLAARSQNVASPHSPRSPVLSSPMKTPTSPSVKGVIAQMRASSIGRRISMSSPVEVSTSVTATIISKPTTAKSILKTRQSTCASAGIQRNRVAFHVSPGVKNSHRAEDPSSSENETLYALRRVSKRFSLPASSFGSPVLHS